MSTFKTILITIAALVALTVLAFTLKLGGLEWNRFFRPKEAAIEREVFKETRSYNEAKLQELVKYRLEYLKAKNDNDAAVVAALRSTIRHTFAEYDRTKLPQDLRLFLETEIYTP